MSDNIARKLAIILHAPPATGKSQVCDRLEARIPHSRIINLDDDWSPTESRYRGGNNRYQSLFEAKESVLTIELCCGEPADMKFPGATQDSPKWVGLLRDSGREVFAFRLRTDYPTAVKRLEDRLERRREKKHEPSLWDITNAIGIREMFEQGHRLVTFPSIPGFQEQLIDTNNMTFDDVCEEILSLTGAPQTSQQVPELQCNAREVKEALLVADALKSGPFEPQGFRERLVNERTRVGQLTDIEVERSITDHNRLKRYNGGTWVRTVVNLADCSVWQGMGSRHWATGTVQKVVEQLRKQGRSTDRLFAMSGLFQLFLEEQPLIVFRRSQTPRQYRIDDGCHRAVAYFLAGLRQAPAYVGSYDGPAKLDWPW